ncbi:MAG: hypothetical protein WAK29_07730 [Terriglobales bacterium]
MKSNTKTREALSNPEVLEKLERLNSKWESFSNADRRRGVNELIALGCPVTEIAKALEMAESAIRRYKDSTIMKQASVRPNYCGNVIDALLQMDDERTPKLPVPPALSRRDQVKEAIVGFIREYFGFGLYLPQTLDLVKRRCDELEYLGNFPLPAPPEVPPNAVFAKYNPKNFGKNLGAPIEFMAVSLLELMPGSPELGPLLRELANEYRSGGLRN